MLSPMCCYSGSLTPCQQERSVKVNFNIDCTPEEARTFFGLPDVT